MVNKSFLLVLSLLGLTLALEEKPSNSENDRPVIGILTLPIHPYESFPVNGTSYIAASYVKWLEGAGARVVPIKVDSTYEEVDAIFPKLNGVLFTGGSADFWEPSTGFKLPTDAKLTPYSQLGCHIFKLVQHANDAGIYTPLWATCLGFQLLHVCAVPNDERVVGSFNGEPGYVQKSEFTKKAYKSNIFNSTWGKRIMKMMSSEYVTYLNHYHGIAPESFITYKNLSDTFNVLSTMKDKSGTSFVGIVEGKNYPIYGVQFHPEKNMYEWLYPSAIPHSPDAVKVSTYLAQFFVSEARKNTNLAEEEELQDLLIYNVDLFYLHKYFEQIYHMSP
jgi:gamma-glutamyl hydrolase